MVSTVTSYRLVCSVILITQTGLLSPLGNPLGKVVNVVTKPVGQLTGQIGNPSGEAMENLNKEVRKEKKFTDEDDPNKPESEMPGGEALGGKEQNAKNPLGISEDN